MAGCCTGTELDLKEMRTPGQKEVGNVLGPLLTAGISQGATPYGGQLSANPDQAQIAAMNMMMGIGGQGQYQQQGSPTMGPSGSNLPGPMTIPAYNIKDNRDPYSAMGVPSYQMNQTRQLVDENGNPISGDQNYIGKWTTYIPWEKGQVALPGQSQVMSNQDIWKLYMNSLPLNKGGGTDFYVPKTRKP